MDPRHPEQAYTRLKELLDQYNRIVNEDLATTTISSKLAQLEREGGLVVQEICLVAPRLHEAMIQASRNRRRDLSHAAIVAPDLSTLEWPYDAKKALEPATEETIEKYVEPNQAEVYIAEPKYGKKKKKSTKKKKVEE